MFELFFSTSGRMKRLPYFLFSALSGGVFLTLSSVFLIQSTGSSIDDWLPVISGGIVGVFETAPLAGLVYATGIWVQICLGFKRSRDFSGKTKFAKVFLVLSVAPMLAFSLFDTPITGFVIGAVVSIPQMILASMMLMKKSIEGDIVGENAEIFGEKPKSKTTTHETSVLGTITNDTDLVARAAELRAVEEVRVAKQEAAQLSSQQQVSPRAGFGRRTVAPSFGNR